MLRVHFEAFQRVRAMNAVRREVAGLHVAEGCKAGLRRRLGRRADPAVSGALAGSQRWCERHVSHGVGFAASRCDEPAVG